MITVKLTMQQLLVCASNSFMYPMANYGSSSLFHLQINHCSCDLLLSNSRA